MVALFSSVLFRLYLIKGSSLVLTNQVLFQVAGPTKWSFYQYFSTSPVFVFKATLVSVAFNFTIIVPCLKAAYVTSANQFYLSYCRLYHSNSNRQYFFLVLFVFTTIMVIDSISFLYRPSLPR